MYTLPQRPPRGVIVFLHGHTQHAYEWGFQSATCIECTGTCLACEPVSKGHVPSNLHT